MGSKRKHEKENVVVAAPQRSTRSTNRTGLNTLQPNEPGAEKPTTGNIRHTLNRQMNTTDVDIRCFTKLPGPSTSQFCYQSGKLSSII